MQENELNSVYRMVIELEYSMGVFSSRYTAEGTMVSWKNKSEEIPKNATQEKQRQRDVNPERKEKRSGRQHEKSQLAFNRNSWRSVQREWEKENFLKNNHWEFSRFDEGHKPSSSGTIMSCKINKNNKAKAKASWTEETNGLQSRKRLTTDSSTAITKAWWHHDNVSTVSRKNNPQGRVSYAAEFSKEEGGSRSNHKYIGIGEDGRTC